MRWVKPAFDAVPFRAGNQAGQKIIRKDFLGPLFATVNREGDALVEEGQVSGVFAAPDLVGGQRRERLQQRSVVRARFARAFKGLVIGVIDEIILQNRVVEAADFR